MSACVDCIDLIGQRFAWGELDCIHLVYRVLERMEIPTPPFDSRWYERNPHRIGRALLRWGKRIQDPTYDGDVLLLIGEQLSFAVVWQGGILYMNQRTEAVDWCPMRREMIAHAFRYCPSSAS
jgi:hypothetical protein